MKVLKIVSCFDIKIEINVGFVDWNKLNGKGFGY